MDLERPGAEPLEVAGLFAIERRREERGWLGQRHQRRPCRDVAHEELVGDGQLQKLVDVAHVPPEQVVELEIVGGRVVIAVPPEPVAAFRNEHLLAGLGERGRRHARSVRRRGLLERRPRIDQLAPAFMVVGVPDPDVEVRVDPGTGEDAHQLLAGAGRGLRDRHRPQLGVVREPAIQRPEERTALALVVLPGVFAVQDDRDDGLSPA